MTSLPDRIQLVDLIDEAVAAGARRPQACAEAGIPERTYWRWIAEGKAAAASADAAHDQVQEPGALTSTPPTNAPTTDDPVEPVQESASAGEPALAPDAAVPDMRLRTGLTATGKRIMADQRPFAVRPTPPNALSDEERAAVLAACHTPAHKSLPPSQIVPLLADQGTYLASEATFYRVLRAAGQNTRRG